MHGPKVRQKKERTNTHTRAGVHGAYRPRSPSPNGSSNVPPPPHATEIHPRLCLLEGNESGSGGTETGTTVTDGLVGDGELSEVVSGHLGLDLDGGERLSVLREASTNKKTSSSTTCSPLAQHPPSNSNSRKHHKQTQSSRGQ